MTAKIDKKNESTKKNIIKNTRSTKYYAAQFGYSTRYFSKHFLKASNGISALNYIGQYVCTQAKRINGIYPQEYKKQNY